MIRCHMFHRNTEKDNSLELINRGTVSNLKFFLSLHKTDGMPKQFSNSRKQSGNLKKVPSKQLMISKQ